MDKDFFKNKIDELKDNPGRLFALLYPYVLIIIIGIGLYYLSNEGNVAQQKVPATILQTVEEPKLEIQMPKQIPPVDIFEISKPTPELIAKGKEIYNRTCAVCHGQDGTGSGPGAGSLNPPPRNFTNPDGWVNGAKLSGIFQTLSDGIPNTGMIAYDFLTPEERFAIAHYIRTEFVPNPPMDDEFDLQAVDMLYNLSEGVNVPGQIPVEAAEKLVLEENAAKVEKVNNALQKVKTQNSADTKLLKEVTDNLQLAMSALTNSNEWKQSPDEFISFITRNVNQNGFNGEVFNLSSDEWNELYNYLNSLL